MEKRRIDLSRCLVRDGKADCHRCEEICPQKAIQDHVVDTAACDGCGLCSAICPAAAIVAPEDYEGALTKAQELAPQVLMCEKASEGGVHPAFLQAHQAEPCALFNGLALQEGCTACGLCAVVCPTRALAMERGEQAALHIDPAACTGCNLCALHCPQGVLELLPQFAGQRDFPLHKRKRHR